MIDDKQNIYNSVAAGIPSKPQQKNQIRVPKVTSCCFNVLHAAEQHPIDINT